MPRHLIPTARASLRTAAVPGGPSYLTDPFALPRRKTFRDRTRTHRQQAIHGRCEVQQSIQATAHALGRAIMMRNEGFNTRGTQPLARLVKTDLALQIARLTTARHKEGDAFSATRRQNARRVPTGRRIVNVHRRKLHARMR